MNFRILKTRVSEPKYLYFAIWLSILNVLETLRYTKIVFEIGKFRLMIVDIKFNSTSRDC